MLKLENYAVIFMLTSLLGALAISSPVLAFFLPSQTNEKFSEFYILGSNHMAEDYPYDIKAGQNYMIYLGISNNIGSSAYYAIYVKLRNQTESLPNSTDSIPSSLPDIYEYRALLVDREVWEIPFNFSFSGISYYNNQCIIKNFIINKVLLYENKTINYEPNNNGYFLEIFFELWMYDVGLKNFSYNNKYVGIWLKLEG